MKALVLLATAAALALAGMAPYEEAKEHLPVIKEHHATNDDQVLKGDQHNILLERHQRMNGESHVIRRFYSSDADTVAKQRDALARHIP